MIAPMTSMSFAMVRERLDLAERYGMVTKEQADAWRKELDAMQTVCQSAADRQLDEASKTMGVLF